MGSMLSAASPLTLLLPCQDGSKYLVEYLASKSFLCHLAASVAINVFGEESGTIHCVNNHLTGRVVLRQHFQVKQALRNRRTDKFQTISKIDIDAQVFDYLISFPQVDVE